MRRLASVFTSKRDKESSSASNASQSSVSLPFKRPNLKRGGSVTVSPLITSLPVNESAPSTPGLSARSDPAHSSASSSGSTSVSLQTPEPEEEPGLTPTLKSKSWTSWLSRRSGTIKRRPAKPDPPPVPQWHTAPSQAEETDDESESESESEQGSSVQHVNVPKLPSLSLSPPSSPHSASRSHLRVLVENSLRHRHSSSPFCQLPNVSPYPRSTYIGRSPYRETLHSSLLKRRMLRRLDSNTPLTAAEESSLLPLNAKPLPALLPSVPVTTDDVAAPLLQAKLTPFSPGLNRWAARLCFENRYMVWTILDGELVKHIVSPSTKFAVADIEYSDFLLAMIDGAPIDSPARELPPSNGSNGSLTTSRPVPHAPSNIPSPLRNEHNPQTIVTSPSISETSTAHEPPVKQSTKETRHTEETSTQPVKRGVRFAEDDKEDRIPVGFLLRSKKQREQKAKFLQEEKERRQFEAEKARVEAERLQREKERKEWERERKAWEAEKKAMEEERKQKLYADEVAAARLRRETQRMGHSGLAGASSSSTSLQETERNNRDSKRYQRPAYDATLAPRRQGSDTYGNSPSPNSSSPGSSRPPSIAGQSSLRNLPVPNSSSRSPSVHSFSSAEDVKAKDPSSRRSSVASTSSNKVSRDRFSSWSSGNPTLMVPPIPAMPMYSMDMPLLPPTAPFMLQQYPRSKSSRDHSPSSTKSSPIRSRHENASSEAVNLQSQHSRPNSESRGYFPPSEPSSNNSRRRSGCENGHSSRSSSHTSLAHNGASSSRSQPNTISRGRPPLPGSFSQPVMYSWNAYPPPYGMQLPMMPNASPNGKPSARRQSTIS